MAQPKTYAEYLHEANERSIAKNGKPMYIPPGMKLSYTSKGKPTFNVNISIGGAKPKEYKPATDSGKTKGRGKSIVLTKRPKDYY